MTKILPKHLAIVMDGNGRWAEKQGLSRAEGHRRGLATVKKVIACCLKEGVPCLSLFAFSSENWRRPVAEVSALMALFLEALETEVQTLAKQGVRLCFIGSRENLSPALNAQMNLAESLTKVHSRLRVNVLVNYGGRWDITEAAKAMFCEILAKNLEVADMTEETFSRFLKTADLGDPDLLIRTSGEQRMSNFFLWQIAYTELYFTDLCWPEFDEAAFYHALFSFSQRKRRYGDVESEGALHA